MARKPKTLEELLLPYFPEGEWMILIRNGRVELQSISAPRTKEEATQAAHAIDLLV